MQVNNFGLINKEKNLKRVYSNAKSIYADWVTVLSREPGVDADPVRKQLRHYSVLSASRRLRFSKAVHLSWNVASALHLVLGVIVVTALSIRFNIPASKRGMPINPSIIFAAIGFIASLGVGSIPLRANGWSRLTLGAIYLVGAAGLIYTAPLLINPHSAAHFGLHFPYIGDSESDKLGVVAALAIGISVAGNIMIDTIEFSALFAGYIKPVSKRYPEVVMVETFMGLLRSLLSNRSGISDVKGKVYICQQLQKAASWLQNEFSKSVTTSNPRIDAVLAERFGRSAAYLLEAQLRVVFANEKASGELREMVTGYITAILRGEYDLLPSSDSVPTTKRGMMRSIATSTRTLAVGAIPVACIVGARYAGLPLSSEFYNWAVVVAVGWAAITLISIIDPLYRTRLADIRDFIASVRGNGK